jgi:hypothetical protein
VTTATASASIVPTPNLPGIVSVFVPSGLTLSKTELRHMAQKASGTIDVGRTPAGKPATVHGVKGLRHDFAPVQRRTAGESAPDPVVGQVRPSLIPAQVWDGTDDAGREALLAIFALINDAPTAPASKTRPATGKTTVKGPGKGTAPREVPAFLRKWAGVTCKTCRDFGYIHGPTAGPKAGRPFRTAQTPATAPTAIPCPTHVKAKGRKTA